MSDPTPAPPPDNKALPVVAGVLIFSALIGTGLFLWYRNPPMEAPPLPPPRVVEQPPPPPEPPPLELADAETQAKGLLSSLSPALAQLLGDGEVLRRVVAAVQLAADGQSFTHLFPTLKPKGEFAVVTKGNKHAIDPRGFARYDSLTTALTAVDGKDWAGAFAKLEPTLQRLFAEVAPPGAKFKEALGRALKPIAEAPLPDQSAEVVPKGLAWAYADPAREAAAPSVKLFWRTGPSNAKKLQELVKAFSAAAGL